MNGWLIAAIVLAALFLIGQIRFGLRVRYDEAGVALWVRFGLLRTQVLPAKPKGEKKPTKPKKERKGHSKKEKKPPEEEAGPLEKLRAVLPTIAQAAGALKRKIRIDQLILLVTWAARDPAAAAIGYGCANAALGTLFPLIDNNFRLKSCQLGADVNYAGDTPSVLADAKLTITLGQTLSFALHYGLKLLIKLSGASGRSAKKQEVTL